MLFLCLRILQKELEGNQIKKQFIFYTSLKDLLQELETQLYVSFDLEYISQIELKNILEKVVSNKKLLNGFINYYKKL